MITVHHPNNSRSPQVAGTSERLRDTSRPQLRAFLHRIHARDAYQRALERGGPYSF
jgi:glutathione S-transferase